MWQWDESCDEWQWVIWDDMCRWWCVGRRRRKRRRRRISYNHHPHGEKICDEWWWVRWLMKWAHTCKMVVCKEEKKSLPHHHLCPDGWKYMQITKNIPKPNLGLFWHVQLQSRVWTACNSEKKLMWKEWVASPSIRRRMLSIKCFHWSLSTCSTRSLETCTHNSVAKI